jgi:GT2 family glycosyltransferase
MLVNTQMIEALGGMDEDFFLYYEEVAFSRAAQQRGWRVEYDPSVSAIHRYPLQNRPISPKMRVITRHSKLLYFLKHLPRWQFLALYGIVRLEAAVQGRWCQLVGRRTDVAAWRMIAEVARRLRAGEPLRGRAVLALAESVEGPRSPVGDRPGQTSGVHPGPGPTAPIRMARTQRGDRRMAGSRLEPRKEGRV